LWLVRFIWNPGKLATNSQTVPWKVIWNRRELHCKHLSTKLQWKTPLELLKCSSSLFKFYYV
jgi:hypothetical protein